MASIEIKGLNDLTKKLNKIKNKNYVVETMGKAVTLVQGQAKALVPVDTGNLRGSIHTSVTTTGNSVVGKIYTNVKYAPFVEYGTGSKGNGTYPDSSKPLVYRSTPWTYTPDGEHFYKTNGHAAQPFMYPAVKITKSKIKNMFKTSINIKIK